MPTLPQLSAPPQLSALLPALRPSYRVPESDGRRQSCYRTLYFDTPEFDLYPDHRGDVHGLQRRQRRRRCDRQLVAGTFL